MLSRFETINQSLVRLTLTVAACASPLDLAWGDPTTDSPDFMGSGFELWASGIKLLLILAVVLALMYGMVWLLRRVSRGGGTGRSGRRVRVVDRLLLAPKRSIETVAVGERVFVLGVTDAQIGLIAELTGEEKESFLAEPLSETRKIGPRFAAILGQATGRGEGVPPAPVPGRVGRADIRRTVDDARVKLVQVFRRARGFGHDDGSTATDGVAGP